MRYSKSVSAAACLLLAIPAFSQQSDQQKVDEIIQHAVRAVAEMREYNVETTAYESTRSLTDGSELKFHRASGQMAFRAPGSMWVDGISGMGRRQIAVADGRRKRQLYADKILEEDLLEADFLSLEGSKLSMLSPLTMVVREMVLVAGSMTGGKNAADNVIRYDGREPVDGIPCDVIAMGSAMASDTWKKMREAHPALPEKGYRRFWRYYVSVTDGRLLRASEEEMVPFDSSRTKDTLYTYRPLQAVAFTFQRFDAAVRDEMGSKPFPSVEKKDRWVGRTLPAVSMTGIDGKPVRWEDFAGKVVVAEAWYVTCGYCKQAMPYYEKMRQRLAGQDVVFMALNFNDDRAEYEQWVRENRSKYGFLFPRADDVSQAAKALDVGGYPRFYVIGRDGKVVMSYDGFGYGNGGADPRLDDALRKAGVELN